MSRGLFLLLIYSDPPQTADLPSKTLPDGLGYLKDNVDSLLEFLKTVDTHLRGVPSA